MTVLQAIILGIVEGITEFLPISSTGHLILVSDLLRISQTQFVKTFEISIQLGAIMAVVVLYWKRIMKSKELIWKVFCGFLPTAIIGFSFYGLVKTYLLGNNKVVLWSLFLGGIFLVIFELAMKKREKKENQKQPVKAGESVENISYKQSFLVGVFQSLAIIPGVSRSAAAIVGGLSLKMKREAIVEFSFLLAIPTMAGATGLDLLKTAPSFTGQEILLLSIGFIISFLVAILGIKFLLNYIAKHSFVAFGVYRILLALFFWVFIT